MGGMVAGPGRAVMGRTASTSRVGAGMRRGVGPAGRRTQSVAAVKQFKETAGDGAKVVQEEIAKAAGGGFAGSMAASAAAAAIEVSADVRRRGVRAGDVDSSYVSLDREGSAAGLVDADGLPLVYSRDAIQAYWDSRPGELQGRWAEFLGLTMPFLTKVTGTLLVGGMGNLKANEGPLAKDAREIMERLGPTYIKMGQMMSVRPDLVGEAAMAELRILQDSVPVFDSGVARAVVEEQLGKPLDEIFSEFGEEPVAAASLAQVYKATLRATGQEVAVKVQRPSVQSTVSKDLYVLRRAAEVYQGIFDRFAPQQRTDYVALLNEWAVGFYTELDFLNEAANQMELKESLAESGCEGVYVPTVYTEYCSRRVLVSEWIDGTKLADLDNSEVKELISIGQDAFLSQLLQFGFFHSDPHPGNLMKPKDPERYGGARLVLLDFGLVARIDREDREAMVGAIVHLANRDYPQLVDDFIALKILPADTDRAIVEPLMDRVMSPYVFGGGGLTSAMQNYEGGFQQITGDMLTAMNDVPFSIPPYFALLARAIAVLEGIALQGEPKYKMVVEAYPFVARRLLSEKTPAFQKALNEILYSKGSGSVSGNGISSRRLAVLINSAMGVVSKEGTAAFVDFDTVPEEAVGLGDSLKFLLGPKGASLRDGLLLDEVSQAADLLARQSVRRTFRDLQNFLANPVAQVPLLGNLFSMAPKPPVLPVPFAVPDQGNAGQLRPVLVDPERLVDIAAPRLNQEEELYAKGIEDLASTSFGADAGAFVRSPGLDSGATLLLAALAQSGSLPSASQGGEPGADALGALLDQLRGFLLPAITGDGKEGENYSGENIEEVSRALGGLTDVEQQALTDFAAAVAERVRSRFEDRAQALLA